MTFHDHFSGHAASYARYRPRHPDILFGFVASCCEGHALAWDCGTGNGQAALGLAPYFRRVVATDASAEQIRHAVPHPRVEYAVAPATQSPLREGSADLVSVAQALHWFPFEAFYAEVRRVLRPGGLLAAWAYGFERVNDAVDAVLDAFERDHVGPFWPPERRYIDDGYRTLPFPFDEIETPGFTITRAWTLAEQLGYLRTWSATRRYLAAHGTDPVAEIEANLAAAWGDPETVRSVRWPVYLRAGRTP